MDEGLREDLAFIRYCTELTGLTPTALARRAGLAPSTVTRHINGTARSRMTLKTKTKLQQALPKIIPSDQRIDRVMQFLSAEERKQLLRRLLDEQLG